MIESLTGQGINVRHACRVLGVSESGYYYWKDRPGPPRTLRRIWLAGEIVDVHKASGGTYGYMRMTAELRHGRDVDQDHYDQADYHLLQVIQVIHQEAEENHEQKSHSVPQPSLRKTLKTTTFAVQATPWYGLAI